MFLGMLENVGPTGAGNTALGLTNNRIRGAIMANAPTTPGIRICEECAGEFVAATASSRFCSRSCSSSFNNKARADHSEETLWARFWVKVDKGAGHGPDGECWHWTARIDGRGYGEIKVKGNYKKAHRLALFGMSGLEDPRFACHHCDNPQCVRPDHLFAGEAIDNVHDMHRKGRAYASGHANPRRKLTDEQVREIRKVRPTHQRGASDYGVSTFTIAGILKGTLYRDVT
jgi:hypothetical protein